MAAGNGTPGRRAVCPEGRGQKVGVATPAFDTYLERIGEEARNRLWQGCPLGRLGTIDEYASLVTYLAGDHYLVGQIISPNGGAVV